MPVCREARQGIRPAWFSRLRCGQPYGCPYSERHGWRPYIGILIILLIPTLAHASCDYVEVLSGASRGPLSAPQADYETVPLRIALSSDARPMLRHIFGHAPCGDWEYQIEPFVESVTSPRSNVEIGCALGLKYTFDTGGDLRPYLKASSGPLYMSQHTLEQATLFNIGSQAALGLQCRCGRDSALLLELRLRHVSNASIAAPNSGIDNSAVLAGWRWKVR